MKESQSRPCPEEIMSPFNSRFRRYYSYNLVKRKFMYSLFMFFFLNKVSRSCSHDNHKTNLVKILHVLTDLEIFYKMYGLETSDLRSLQGNSVSLYGEF